MNNRRSLLVIFLISYYCC